MVKTKTREQFWNHVEYIGKQYAGEVRERSGLLYVNYALWFVVNSKTSLRNLKEGLNSHLDFMLKKLTDQINDMKVE